MATADEPMLSSHPLPVEALAGPVLRRIFTDTPPAPKTARRRSPPPERAPLTERFIIEGYLESGGTADVYVATELGGGRRLAIKVLREASAGSPVLRAHFLTGARAATRIQHENVVRVLDVSEPAHGAPYAVMALLEGKPLDAVIGKERSVTPALALELTRQVATGLCAAHRQCVVHCDVKPENLFVTAGPEGVPIVKILDFDLANVDGAPDVGEDHILRGTAKYMAPEQIVGDPVDGRTDVYALGVVLFRLLTGQLPFDLPLGAALLRHQLYSPLPPVSWLVERLDPRIEALVSRATRKNPGNRYGSMLELLADLEAIQRGEEPCACKRVNGPDVYQPQSERGLANARTLALAG